ncbi:MAG: DUF4349 domain-containing protein [Planctomycetota bacterium]
MSTVHFHRRSLRRMLAVALLLFFSGCGAALESMPNEVASYQAVETMDAQSLGKSDIADATPLPADGTKRGESSRKIVYTASVDLVVDDYAEFEAELPRLVSRNKGFVASSDTNRRYRNSQSGRWVVRVPVDSYDAFLSGVVGLGFTESRTENAEDVTEEYVDLEARIANKKRLETRILSMLDQRAGKLAEVLEIERELARVREEIETMEGRMRYLRDQTTLTTVTIECREQKEYVPPQPPTLISRITKSWGDSTRSLRRGGEDLLVGSIAMVPWIPVLLFPLWFLRWYVKGWWRGKVES